MITIVDYDRLPPRYDRVIYKDKKTGEYSLIRATKQWTRIRCSVVFRIIIINLLMNPSVKKIWRESKRYQRIEIEMKTGEIKQMSIKNLFLRKKYPQLYKIQKEITKNIIKII